MILILMRMSLMRTSPATRFAVAGVLAATSLLAGCGNDDTAATGNGRQVAAAFYPLAFVAERVAGEHAGVTNLTSPGGEPHDLELGVAQVALVADSDLVLVEHGFQPAVDAAVEENAEGRVLDIADVITLAEAAHHEDESGAEEGEADEHDHGDVDPHFWQDPLLLADVGDAVADELSDLDPSNAEDYRANAAELRAELEQLDADYSQGLASCERTTVVVSHDAFGYLSKYGLVFEPIAGLSPDAEPTPSDLARLETLARAEGITTVFSETLASPKMSEALASDLGIDTAVLDPIEGLADNSSGDDYLSLMRTNLTALEKANGC